MSKADREGDARLQGMDYALRVIKASGIEAFEKELQWRCNRKIKVSITQQELNDASNRIKEQTYDTIRCMALIVLHDEFDFGKKRLQRFNERYNRKVEGLTDNYVDWEDYIRIAEEIMGEKMEVRWNR